MRAGSLMAVVMVTITAVTTEKCQKIDPGLWDYTSCPRPESSEWMQLKIKMNCDKHHDYHCASNSQGCDVQMCVKRIYCEAGHRTLLDPDKDTAICAPCPPDRYQTTGFWSNERSFCVHEKTKCDGDGQIECQPGSTITDRSCRCNIHQNLALQNYAFHNETCCTKNDPLCECVQFKSPCPNGTVRHDNYKCLKECPPNSFRLWDSETCYPNSTTVTGEMTTAHQTSTSGSTELPDTVNVGVVVGVIIGGLGLVGLIVGLWLYHRMKKRNKDLQKKDEEEAVPLQEQIPGEGRAGEKTSNGHIDGCKPVDMANGHRVHVEDYRKCRRPGKRTSNGHIDRQKLVNTANGHIDEQEPVHMEEEEDTEKKYLLQSPGAEEGSSTKGIGKDLNNISNKGERIRNESVQALVHPLGKEMTGGQVIVKNYYLKCEINSKDTITNIHDGNGTTINLGKNHKTKTTFIENPNTGNEDIGSCESMKGTSERSSLVAENPDNQWNSHSHDNQWNSHSHDNQPQPEVKEESTGSLFKDAESEHRPMEHEEHVMTELKFHTDISSIGSSSEETAVKLTGSDPHERMEEVRT